MGPAGIADNILWNQCGGYKATFPPMTIYDNLYLGNRFCLSLSLSVSLSL